ncbi:MAG: isoprenoid biosynthesis glyoxalase ElbB [Bacteroidales bacterium]
MNRPKKFAVILSGCGVYDGAEIHEATLSMYFISKHGGMYELFAPDMDQHHVVNHLTGDEMKEKRNVLVEAARIARGKIRPLLDFKAEDFDGLLFPGGFGVAKNLSDYAFKGAECTVLPEVEKAIKDMVAAGKPVGALCIAPVVLARVLGDVELTIGQDTATASDVEKLGARHRQTAHGQIVADSRYKVVTTPCYMLDSTIAQIGEGAEKVVLRMMEWM